MTRARRFLAAAFLGASLATAVHCARRAAVESDAAGLPETLAAPEPDARTEASDDAIDAAGRDPPADPESALAEKLALDTPLVRDLRELTEGIGGRMTGSAAMDRAVVWAIDRLRAAGLEDVHAEEYVASRLWVASGESAEITQPGSDADAGAGDALRIAGRPMSIGTPPAGIEAPVVDVGNGASLDGVRSKLRGAWALVHTTPMKTRGGLFRETAARRRVQSRAEELGAAGVLWMSERAHRELYRLPIRSDAELTKIPAVIVERDGALRIAKMLRERRAVRVRVALSVDAPENAAAKNVVAEVRGREASAPAIVLGAHLDSFDLGQGAQDDGCNAALVIDVARQMMDLARAGARPRRTVRFALYSGEELGLYGSTAHARAHRADTAAMIVFDEGGAKMTGYAMNGRQVELFPVVDAVLGRFPKLGPFKHTDNVVTDMDSFSYFGEGIPTLSANQPWEPYALDYHAETDTFDKVDLASLKVNAAIAGVTAWALAEAPRLPARRTRDAGAAPR